MSNGIMINFLQKDMISNIKGQDEKEVEKR